MQFAIVGEHREYFRQHGYVEFEGLVSLEEITACREALRAALPSTPSSAWDCLQAGRDLWRAHSALRKVACARRLANVAADLTDSGSLRLVYDQLFGWGRHPECREEALRFFETPWNLMGRSAFQNVKCGVLLALADNQTTSPFLPRIAGHGVYIRGDQWLDWSELIQQPAELWLLVYSLEGSVYIFNPADPHVHRPKQYGYGFGDRLRDEDFPLVALK